MKDTMSEKEEEQDLAFDYTADFYINGKKLMDSKKELFAQAWKPKFSVETTYDTKGSVQSYSLKTIDRNTILIKTNDPQGKEPLHIKEVAIESILE